MGALELILLILGAAVVAVLWTAAEWMPRYARRNAVNQRLGVGHEPELHGKLRKAFLIVWLSRTVQLGLIGFAVFSRPSGLGWIAVALAFIASLIVYFPADKTRRNLLA